MVWNISSLRIASDAITTLHFIKIGKGNVINGNFLRKLDSYHHTSIFLRYTILRRAFIPFAQSFLCTLNSWSNIKKIYITFWYVELICNILLYTFVKESANKFLEDLAQKFKSFSHLIIIHELKHQKCQDVLLVKGRIRMAIHLHWDGNQKEKKNFYQN